LVFSDKSSYMKLNRQAVPIPSTNWQLAIGNRH
jgi:hypothetical protein